MKKYFIALIASLFIIIGAFCLHGCSLFKKREQPSTPPEQEETNSMKAPESARFDPVTNILYLKDCRESGVGYMEIYIYSGRKKSVIGKIDPENNPNGYYEEDGYLGVRLTTTYAGTDSFTFSVCCQASRYESYYSVTETYTLICGGSVNQREGCTFDADSGLYTWAPVEGATSYKIGWNRDTVTVTEPQYVVPSTDDYFYVTPQFDDGRYGTTVRIYVSSPLTSDTVKYDVQNERFYWKDYGYTSFEITVTENGESVTEKVTQPFFPYKISESATVSLTRFYTLSRPFTSAPVTFTFKGEQDGVTFNPNMGLLSWNKMQDATSYTVEFSLEDGEKKSVETTATKLNLANEEAFSGALTAVVKPVPSDDNYVIRPSQPCEFGILRPIALQTSYAKSSNEPNVSVTISCNDSSVGKYVITASSPYYSYTTERERDESVKAITVDVPIPEDDLITVTVSRTLRLTDNVYVKGNTLNSTQKVVFLSKPQVEIASKVSASYHTEFTLKVKFPEKLKGLGTMLVNERSVGNKDKYYESRINDDKFIFCERPDEYLSTKSDDYLVYFYNFWTTDGARVLTYGGSSTRQSVSCMPAVTLSADKDKLSWNAVEGATKYNVYDDISKQKIYEGTELYYNHNITEAGDYKFFVTASCDEYNVLDGISESRTITKLAAPVLSRQDNGIKVSADYGNLVTEINGAQSDLQADSLKAAIPEGGQATVTAYLTRSSYTNTLYIDSDVAECTVHRIAAYSSGNMQLQAQVSGYTEKVSWAELDDVNKYDCRLLYKPTADSSYELLDEFESEVTYFTVTQRDYGYYQLSVTPESYSEGDDLFIYLGGETSAYFAKDNLPSFSFVNKLTFKNSHLIKDDGVKIKVTFYYGTYYALFDDTENIDLSTDGELMLKLDRASSVGSSVKFEVDYPENYLSDNNVFPAKSTSLDFTTVEKTAPESFTGETFWQNYDQSNSSLDVYSVRLKTSGHTLGNGETYRIVRYECQYNRTSGYTFTESNIKEEVNCTVTDDVLSHSSKQLDARGFTVKKEITNFFAVRTVANFFKTENGGLVYTKSSHPSTKKFEFFGETVRQVDNVSGVKSSEDTVEFTLKLVSDNSPTYDKYYIEYIYKTGSWVNFSSSDNTVAKEYENKYQAGSFGLRAYSPALNDGKLTIRVMRKGRDYKLDSGNLKTSTNSCYYYYTIDVPSGAS